MLLRDLSCGDCLSNHSDLCRDHGPVFRMEGTKHCYPSKNECDILNRDALRYRSDVSDARGLKSPSAAQIMIVSWLASSVVY